MDSDRCIRTRSGHYGLKGFVGQSWMPRSSARFELRRACQSGSIGGIHLIKLSQQTLISVTRKSPDADTKTHTNFSTNSLRLCPYSWHPLSLTPSALPIDSPTPPHLPSLYKTPYFRAHFFLNILFMQISMLCSLMGTYFCP